MRPKSGSSRAWVTEPLTEEDCWGLLAMPGDPSGAAIGTESQVVLDTVTIPTPRPEVAGLLTRGSHPSVRDRLERKGRTVTGVVRGERFRLPGSSAARARVVVVGGRCRVGPLLRESQEARERARRRDAAGRKRGGERRAVPWGRLRGCSPVEGCGISVCPRCGAGTRRRAVIGRAHALAVLAEHWGYGLAMVTLTAPWASTTAEVVRRKRGASAWLAALSPTGRYVSESKNKPGDGPACCGDVLCLVCGGQGRMRAQHYHVHGLCLLPREGLDFSGLHGLLREHERELGWHSFRVDRVRSASHAAGYLGAYLGKVSEDPWQWVRLRTMLGLRWGESWGVLRGAECSETIETAEGGRLWGHQVVLRERPTWDASVAATAARLAALLRELRRGMKSAAQSRAGG
jgi:hypothetical protein